MQHFIYDEVHDAGPWTLLLLSLHLDELSNGVDIRRYLMTATRDTPIFKAIDVAVASTPAHNAISTLPCHSCQTHKTSANHCGRSLQVICVKTSGRCPGISRPPASYRLSLLGPQKHCVCGDPCFGSRRKRDAESHGGLDRS